MFQSPRDSNEQPAGNPLTAPGPGAFLQGAWSPVCGMEQCSLQSAAKSVVRCLEFMALFVEHHGVLMFSMP